MMKKKIFIGLISTFFLFSVLTFVPTEVFAQTKKAKKLYDDGIKLYNSQNYQGAINKFAEAIVQSPNFPDAYFYKGYSHYNLNQYDQAVQDLTTALSQGYKNRFEIYRVRGYIYKESKRYDAAIADYVEALKIDPNNLIFLLYLGELYFIREDCQNALALFKRANQISPQSGDASYMMALCYNQAGETQAQAAAAADAIRKGTRYVGESYYLYGDAQLKDRNSIEAMKAFERSIAANPKVILDIYILLPEIYRSQGRFQDAINTVLKGLDNYPNNGSLYINLTWYYSLADRHNEAVQAGLNAIQYAPASSLSYTNLCRAYNDIRNYNSAIRTCNKALEIEPDDGETNFYLGRSYSFLNQTKIADEYFRKAVTGLIRYVNENPENPDGFYLLGNAYFAVGNREKAIEAYLRCVELSPRFAKARVNLGYTYFLQKNTKAAQQQYEELRKFDAVNAERLKQLMEQK
jgi:tetratricopeptide (TPR) repeat protein